MRQSPWTLLLSLYVCKNGAIINFNDYKINNAFFLQAFVNTTILHVSTIDDSTCNLLQQNKNISPFVNRKILGTNAKLPIYIENSTTAHKHMIRTTGLIHLPIHMWFSTVYLQYTYFFRFGKIRALLATLKHDVHFSQIKCYNFHSVQIWWRSYFDGNRVILVGL